MKIENEFESADSVQSLFSDVAPFDRYRMITDFTRNLTELCHKHGVRIMGGRIEQIDLDWKAPDAEQWEQYAINEDDFLVRGFWNQHVKAVVR